MKLYTINATCEQGKYTIQENASNHKTYSISVSEILAEHNIDGFTIERVEGYWQGKPERSYKISVAVDNDSNIDAICEQLRDTYQQDAVMLTMPDNSVKFI
jgi:hypothetical protein